MWRGASPEPVRAVQHHRHPAPQVLARYAEQGVPVLRTDELGTVEFVTNGERLWVRY
jgi:beta-lactamase superfamily II metal-dependent hydrolase